MCRMTSCWSNSSLSLGWDGFHPSSPSRQIVGGSPLLSLLNSLCDSAAVLQLSHGDHIGTAKRRSSLEPTGELQETLTLTTGALSLHLSKFHWLLYTSLWFAAHGALVSSLGSGCQVVFKGPCHHFGFQLHPVKEYLIVLNSQLTPQNDQQLVQSALSGIIPFVMNWCYKMCPNTPTSISVASALLLWTNDMINEDQYTDIVY